MSRYKPSHQEIFEPYAVRLSATLRVAYEDRMRIEMDDFGVMEHLHIEQRDYMLRFAAEKRWKPDELMAQLANARHNADMENGVEQTAWEDDILKAAKATSVAMQAVQEEVYGLLSDVELAQAVASTSRGIEVIDRAAQSVLDETNSAKGGDDGDEEESNESGKGKAVVEIPGVIVYRTETS